MSDKESKPVNLRLRRNKEGVTPVEGVSPNLAIPVKIKPMTYGDSRSYKSFGDPLFSWTDEEKVRCINEHVVEPEIEIEDVDDLNNSFDAWTIEELMQAIFVYSGMARLFEADEEGNEEAGEEEDSKKPISA